MKGHFILIEPGKSPEDVQELVEKLVTILNDNIVEFSNVYKLETGVIPLFALRAAQNHVTQSIMIQNQPKQLEGDIPILPTFVQKGEA
jgi:hypothetical protein